MAADSFDAKEVVLRFNGCINSRDLEGLTSLMSADHRFIDSEGELYQGKAAMRQAWRQFFESYPDYRNHFESVISRGDAVAIQGYSSCAEAELDGPALWQAKVERGLVKEWRVYLDTPKNRRKLGLSEGNSPAARGGVEID
jgi:ketosteroid isomerase-like protein